MPPADPAALRAAVATVRRLAAAEAADDLLALLPFTPVWTNATDLIAREFVRLLDAGAAVRVRGLEWVESVAPGCSARAASVFGEYFADSDGWHLSGGPWNNTESIAESKAECESSNRSRLAAALEPLLPEVRT